MTVDPCNFDPDLSGHAAVIHDWDGERVCHAVVSVLRSDGTAEKKTQCGRAVDVIQQDVLPRERFSAALCGGCWPDSVIEADSARRVDP